METTDYITGFYCRDDISRQAPEKRDYVVQYNEDRSRESIQKWHMVMTVTKTYEQLQSKNFNA